MKKPQKKDDYWIVYLDDYSNYLVFYDVKTAWDFYYKSLASNKSDDELMSE
jgi:hypothetical protein